MKKILEKICIYLTGKCKECGSVKRDWRGVDACVNGCDFFKTNNQNA